MSACISPSQLPPPGTMISALCAQVWAVHYAEEQEEVVPQVWAALAGDDALLSGTASFEQQIGKWVTEKEKRVPTSIWRCARL